MRDNVTPFRPRKPQPKKPRLNLQSPRGKAVLVEALVLTAVVLSALPWLPLPPAFAKMPPAAWQLVRLLPLIPGIAALFIAIENRTAAMPWARTHHEFALRTLVIAACATTLFGLLGFIPMLGIVGLVGVLVSLAWGFLRACAGTGLAIFRRPIPNPMGLLL
jgi:uncharacterized membrane protein